jgi:hypothetical protein
VKAFPQTQVAGGNTFLLDFFFLFGIPRNLLFNFFCLPLQVLEQNLLRCPVGLWQTEQWV